MKRVAPEKWMHIQVETMPEAVWEDDNFLVQVFPKENGVVRISVNKKAQFGGNDWEDGITWDELQKIKSEVGYGNFDAVEVYPAQRDVVNVANMRHLWVLDKKLNFAWRRK